ncbi:MAG: protein SCO1/2 [Bacteroidia bacterium]|jgi:protein SCO1/2
MKKILPILVVVAALCIGMVVVYPMLKGRMHLKIYQPTDINPDLVDEELRRTGMNHRIADFNLTDQNGETVTNETFEGKIYVADFFFTTCKSICPKMSKNMVTLSDDLQDDANVMFLSHSVMPVVDSVPVLRAYADLYQVDDSRWKMVTGSKQHIYELARKSYFAATTEGDGGVSDFIHTENFVLIDPDRRIRGFYDGTSAEEMERLALELEALELEYEFK